MVCLSDSSLTPNMSNNIIRHWNYGLDVILKVLLKRSAELKGEKLEGFMFAVRIVQSFKL